MFNTSQDIFFFISAIFMFSSLKKKKKPMCKSGYGSFGMRNVISESNVFLFIFDIQIKCTSYSSVVLI